MDFIFNIGDEVLYDIRRKKQRVVKILDRGSMESVKGLEFNYYVINDPVYINGIVVTEKSLGLKEVK